MNIDKKTIDPLPETLSDVFERIYGDNEDTDLIQLIYGADDVLVVISTSDEPDPEFQELISTAINETEHLCGFVISDGPNEYSNYTSAYIRHKPDNAYEYILPICSKLGINPTEAASVFKTAYQNTGDEGEKAPQTAAAHIYLNLGSYESTNYVKELSNAVNVDEKTLRQTIVQYQKDSV